MTTKKDGDKPLFESLGQFYARVERNEKRAEALARGLRDNPLGSHPQQCKEVAELVATWMEDASEAVQGKACRAIIATLSLGK